MATSRICSIPDCGKALWARGWCSPHYQRWQRHGDPLAGGTTYGEPMRYFRDVVMTYEGDDCLTWPFARCDGYGRITGGGRTRVVSRLVCIEAHGPPPTPEHEAAHSCGKGHEGCCTKGHLSWKTPVENRADTYIHGSHIRGERNGLAKVTEAEAREICALRGCMLQRDIAKQFGIANSTVSAIHSGRNWAWLNE